MLCFCFWCNSKFSTASACPRTDDLIFQYFKWHLTFPTCEMRKKKKIIHPGWPNNRCFLSLSFHGKQKRETETLAGTRQHKEGKISRSVAFVLTRGSFICCSSFKLFIATQYFSQVWRRTSCVFSLTQRLTTYLHGQPCHSDHSTLSKEAPKSSRH